MSLEIVPPPEKKRPSPLSRRRVKSYDETVADVSNADDHDYDRHRITQFIRQPFSTSAAGDEDAVLSRTPVEERTLACTVSGLIGAAGEKAKARVRNSLPVSVRYNDTGSFEEVDEQKVS